MITTLRFFSLLAFLTGILYPLSITLLSQLLMPEQANGSLLKNKNEVIGSILIAQNSPQEGYFYPRPSAIDYDPLKPSGGSNWGPTSKELKNVIEERKKKIGSEAPVELLYASGSGLDPHISLEAAYYQIKRVAKARALQEEDLKALIDSHAEKTQWGFLKTGYVNVLVLNRSLDAQ